LFVEEMLLTVSVGTLILGWFRGKFNSQKAIFCHYSRTKLTQWY
jgi:hypothetical protein